MITIFTAPKRFDGHIGLIQRNAIRSWKLLAAGVEVILFGDDTGVSELAQEIGVRHQPEVARNEYGTPLLDSIFSCVEQTAAHDIVCYVNADIIILSDFMQMLRMLKGKQWLVVGRRWDLDVTELVDFGRADWEYQLRSALMQEGRIHPPYGSDYFVYARGGLGRQLPPFAVGRKGWDNWVIYNARRNGTPVIDATVVATVVHQNHGYSHVPKGTGISYLGPESDANAALADETCFHFDLEDATHRITTAGPRLLLDERHLRQRLRQAEVLHPALGWATRPMACVADRLAARVHKYRAAPGTGIH